MRRRQFGLVLQFCLLWLQMLVEYSGFVLDVVDSPPCEVEGVCVFPITRRVAFEVCLSACVCWCTCGRYIPGFTAPSLFFPGVGVGCSCVGCHAARRVVVAQEDKMIAFVYVK